MSWSRKKRPCRNPLDEQKAIAADYDVQLAKAKQEAAAYKAKIKQQNAEIQKLASAEQAKKAEEEAKRKAAEQKNNSSSQNSSGTARHLQEAPKRCRPRWEAVPEVISPSMPASLWGILMYREEPA